MAEVATPIKTPLPETTRQRAQRLAVEAESAAGNLQAEAVTAFEHAAAVGTEAVELRGNDPALREELRSLVREVERRLAIIRGLSERRR